MNKIKINVKDILGRKTPFEVDIDKINRKSLIKFNLAFNGIISKTDKLDKITQEIVETDDPTSTENVDKMLKLQNEYDAFSKKAVQDFKDFAIEIFYGSKATVADKKKINDLDDEQTGELSVIIYSALNGIDIPDEKG